MTFPHVRMVGRTTATSQRQEVHRLGAEKPRLVRKPSKAVAARLNDNKRLSQVLFAVGLEDSLELGVYRVLRRRQDAEIHNALSETLHKYETTKISVTCHKYPLLFLSRLEQLAVFGARETQLGCLDDIVSEASEDAQSDGVNVLISKESHDVPVAS